MNILGYEYKINSTGFSSARYGNCEVCHLHASEVFGQTEYKIFSFSDEEVAEFLEKAGEEVEKVGKGYVKRVYGHEACLLGLRKEAR